MTRFCLIIAAFVAFMSGSIPAMAQVAGMAFPDRVMGQERAPVLIEEYISLTCPHCADFYLNTLPELEKRYVKTGKVRIIMHDYPIDGLSLKAAALARCMPGEEFYPFISILYENQKAWVLAPNPDKVLVQYASMAGLESTRAQSCLNDQTIQSAVIAERSKAEEQYAVKSTPTFVFNNGAEKIEGAEQITAFAATIDRMLADTKKK